MDRWFSRRSLLLHLAVLVWVPGCAVAAWWQVTVALAGNSLGWLYAVEWPVFAVLGVFGWWQLVHDDPGTVRERRARRKQAPAPEPTPAAEVGERPPADQDTPPVVAPAMTADVVAAIHLAEDADAELAAYNAYLATLATTGRRKSWRDPTGEGSNE